jgi:hypothetical protein
MASTVLDLSITNIQRMDIIVAGPARVEIDELAFILPGMSFDALKEMDRRFGKQTAENKKQVRDFHAWRNLTVNGMELRVIFRISEHNPEWENVRVSGFKSKDAVSDSCFNGPSAYDCYVRFLDEVAPSRHHTNAVAMGQHVRLGSQSLLGILPEALFRNLMQPLVPMLKHWNISKELNLMAVIRKREFAVTKGLLDELVETKSSNTTGELLFYATMMREAYVGSACVGLDQRFRKFTPEEEEDYSFYAKRRLHINGRVLQFKFEYDRYDGIEYIRVSGLGKVEGLASRDLRDREFVYFLDTLLRHGTNHVHEVTTRER